MNSDESSPTKASEPPIGEPLIPVLDVVGIKGPEPLEPAPEEPVGKLTPYEEWRANPNNDTLFKATQSLKPTMDSILYGTQGNGNPHLAAKARVITAKAIQTYNPDAGATLPTWVSQQLRQLARDTRKSNNTISIPEGVQLDSYAIYRGENEFEDEFGREPTVDELADKTHMSVKRIESVRNKMRPVANESSYDTDEASTIQGSTNDYSKDATDYIYNDSDLLDKKLLEYTIGYGGADMLDNKQIMEKLHMSPVQLTRRKARLSMRIKDIIDDLEALK